MKKSRIIALVLCVFLAISFIGVSADTTEVAKEALTTNGESAKKLIEQSANLILLKYKFDITREQLYENTLMALLENHPELLEEAYEAIFSGLDEHSEYYTEEEFKHFLENMSGEFAGIGVIISQIPDGLLVSGITDNSSADQAGIRKGDIITTVDGVAISGMPLEEARSYVIGKEGTYVKIGVKRNGQYIEYTVVRKKVVVEPGSYEIIDANIGYIVLDSFDASAPILVENALNEFDRHGIKKIIFDLRYNPGGSVDAFSKICQRLIPKGPTIHFEFKNKSQDFAMYSSCSSPKYSLIVLANEYSASAAEAFCGAVQDSGVGIVVGTKTYGKGTMQNLTSFRIGGGIKLTEAEYLTRNKRHINGIGIEPNYYEDDSIIRMRKAGFNDLDFSTELKLGDESELVLALNQRLDAMGYDVGVPSKKFTEKTDDAVRRFQAENEMEMTGICDVVTQLKIETIMQTLEFSDNQIFKTALDLFRKGTYKKYIKKY